MPTLDQYLSSFEYRCADCASGVRLHFIGSEECSPDQVSVTVSVDFGSSHLSCADVDGNVKVLPVGLAHFMEHYLFWLHFQEHLIPLEHTYIATPNAVVTYDRSLWGIRNATVAREISFNPEFDEVRTIAGVCDLVRRFLTVLTEDHQVSPSLIERTVGDIYNEIGERHSNLNYRLELKLRESLYSVSPVRHDILGGRESLKDIQVDHVELAMRLIRANVRSVVILAHRLTEALISEVVQTVEGLLPDAPAVPMPLAPPTEPAKVYKVTSGLPGPYEFERAYVLLGAKLLPLQHAFPGADEFRRAYVLSHVLMHYAKRRCGGLLSPHARAYFVSGVEEDGLFFWEHEQVVKVIRELKKNLLERIKGFRDGFDRKVSYGLASMIDRPHRLMRACHAADLYKLKLTEFMGTFPELTIRDADQLIDELNETRENLSLVYTELMF
jgi:hypothetical protein